MTYCGYLERYEPYPNLRPERDDARARLRTVFDDRAEELADLFVRAPRAEDPVELESLRRRPPAHVNHRPRGEGDRGEGPAFLMEQDGSHAEGDDSISGLILQQRSQQL